MSALRAAAFALLPALGCGRHATRADCDAVMDHYADMLVRETNPGLEEGQLRAQYDKARKRAGEDPSFVDCPKQITVGQARCALSAVNVPELERCLE